MQPISRVHRRFLALAALAAAVLVIPTASAGSTASIKGVGAGKVGEDLIEFELSAHVENDPTTFETGFGQVKIDQAGFGTFWIDVQCVVVGSNPFYPGVGLARLDGKVTRSTHALFPVGTATGVAVSDGGEPSGDLPVDGIDFNETPPPEEFGCPPSPGFAPPNVTQGNIVVKIGGRN